LNKDSKYNLLNPPLKPITNTLSHKLPPISNQNHENDDDPYEQRGVKGRELRRQRRKLNDQKFSSSLSALDKIQGFTGEDERVRMAATIGLDEHYDYFPDDSQSLSRKESEPQTHPLQELQIQLYTDDNSYGNGSMKTLRTPNNMVDFGLDAYPLKEEVTHDENMYINLCIHICICIMSSITINILDYHIDVYDLNMCIFCS
jgi:hypothetical protein